MALSQKFSGIPKQISAGSSSAGVVYYVVPEGREFNGTLFLNAAASAKITARGALDGQTYSGITGTNTSIPVRLIGGTAVSVVSSTSNIIGVEQ